jgi:redox-sensitive bicupin YhaK (pirin superfamily)
MSIQIYPPEQQGVGAFDGGKFVEQRPIGFPGDSSSVSRLGPLFYWAWGKADQDAVIDMHPHQAFEIMTYVISGEVDHQDSLGIKQTVVAGGAQVIQAGSGVYHGEAFRGGHAEAFQIWFEPHLNQTVKMPPSYNQYNHDQFPLKETDGAAVKTVIGEGSPIHIEAEAKVFDITLQPGAVYTYPLAKDRLLSFLVIQGSGTVNEGSASNITYKDYVIIQPDTDQTITFQAASDHTLRFTAIEVPAKVDYPLYRKS